MEATTDAVAQAEAIVELGIETLRGDIRDRILDNIVRQMPCWTKMSEHEQRTMIGRADEVAGKTVREAIKVVAHQGFDHLVVSTGKWTVKDGLKLEVGASGSVDDITKLAEHGAKPAVLVLAEPSVFFGQRADALADKDQPDLPIDEGDESEDGDGDSDEAEADRSPLPEPPARETRSRRTREPADA